jgi:HD-GYP domain-containing protein (c-di-GMP phosphodiesterase class II)
MLKDLVRDEAFKKIMKLADSSLKRVKWWAIPQKEGAAAVIKRVRKDGKMITDRSKFCRKQIMAAYRKSISGGREEPYFCSGEFEGICFPLTFEGSLMGHLGLTFKRKKTNPAAVSFLKTSIKLLITRMEKEAELSRLHGIIKPRAIALSTIHTIHRLLSSTLNLDELIPKIARLCLQVLRAKRCTIMLFNKEKGILVPKVSVDFKNKTHRSRAVRLGRGIAGKVAKNCEVFMSSKALSAPLIDEDVIGVITVHEKEEGKPFDVYDREILITFAEQAVIAIRNAQLYKEQQELVMGSIKSLVALLKIRGKGTYNHHESLSVLAQKIGRKLGLKEEPLKGLFYATQLHDAGQVTFPRELLEKQAELSPKEVKMIKEHPQKGVNILKHLKVLKPAIPIILYHHERFDGSGYPKQLEGDKIPIGARIMSLVCAFEAMLSKRPYRTKKTIEEAISEIHSHSGTQFDPDVVRTFMEVLKDPVVLELLKKEGHGVR